MHIHGQPGGYDLNLSDDDVTAGAFCEGAGRIYARGQGVVAKGNKAIHYLFENLREAYPDLKPRRILDIGCGTGGSAVAAKAFFPDAEVHGIDIGAGLMRYAHARAELQGVPVHFATQSGEQTDFPDGHFDLIVSGTLLHEMSFKAMYNMCRESHRLLSAGGVMAHLEVALRHKDVDDLYFQSYRDWSTHYNAEPFLGKVPRHGCDRPDGQRRLREAGRVGEVLQDSKRRPVVGHGCPKGRLGGDQLLKRAGAGVAHDDRAPHAEAGQVEW